MIDLPWRAIGVGVAVLVVLAMLGWVGHRIRLSYHVEQAQAAQAKAEKSLSNYQAAAEREARRAALEKAADARADQLLAKRVDSLTMENARLHALLSRMAQTVERIDAQGNRTVAINPDRWLCLSTFLTRDAADIAACQARTGDGSLPDAVRR